MKAADDWDVYFNITENVKITLDKNGITIPYPLRDIHYEERRCLEFDQSLFLRIRLGLGRAMIGAIDDS